MKTYRWENPQALADHLRERAVQLDQQAERKRKSGASAKAIREIEVERNVWGTVAELVRDSEFDELKGGTSGELRTSLAAPLPEAPKPLELGDAVAEVLVEEGGGGMRVLSYWAGMPEGKHKLFAAAQPPALQADAQLEQSKSLLFAARSYQQCRGVVEARAVEGKALAYDDPSLRAYRQARDSLAQLVKEREKKQ